MKTQKAKLLKKLFSMLKIPLMGTFLLLFINPGFGQNRNFLTSSDISPLSTLIGGYINDSIISYHSCCCQPGGYEIHDTANFFGFHKAYIEGMEDYFSSQSSPNGSLYIPLPKWNSADAVPWTTIDNSCSSAGCGGSCAAMNNTGPNTTVRPQPASLTGTNLCNYPTQGSLVNATDPWHGTVHNNIGGVMAQFKSPAAFVFWPWHGYVDDVFNEWQCNSCRTTDLSRFPKSGPDLYMKDTYDPRPSTRDIGIEPNTDPGPMWVSQDIWVRNSNDGIANQRDDENIQYVAGQPVYVYVRIRNRGCANSTASSVIRTYWTHASTGLVWPSSWNTIGSQNIPVIQPGDQTIVTFTWTPPSPSAFDTDNNHFCLLARIETSPTSPYGMKTPETSDVDANTRANNNIIWKNISVVEADANTEAVGTPNLKKKHKLKIASIVEKLNDYHLDLKVRDCETSSFLNVGTIKIDLGDELYNRWVKGGKVGKGVTVTQEDRLMTRNLNGITIKQIERRNILNIMSCDAFIGNLRLDAFQSETILVEFARKSETFNGTKRVFEFDIIQVDNSENQRKPVGGERYQIHYPASPQVNAASQRSGQLAATESSKESSLMIYPNPAETMLNIVSGNSETQSVTIFDIYGRIIYTGSLTTELSVDVTGFAKGIYFIKIQNPHSFDSKLSRIIIK